MIKSILLLFLFPIITFAQTTAIPDANFEQALIDLGYDTGTPDGYVPTANINTLTSLNVWNKNISNLTGIEDFIALTSLNCDNNHLSGLNVSQNTALYELYCSRNQITSLDLSNNTVLFFLDCFENDLTSLDVSNNNALGYLGCWDNQLTSLDLSSNTALNSVSCKDNLLTCLNIKNGSNQNITYFSSTSNPNLLCIEVDDVSWSTTNWTVAGYNIDSTTSFSTNCNNPCSSPGLGLMTYVPDDNFEQALIDLGYDTGALDDSVPTGNIENLTYLSVNNQSIADLTGIEDFIALEQLYCGLNQLTALDISQNAALIHLNVKHNDLDSFNISNNPSLLSVYCTGNQLTHIEVGAAPLLYSLECESNQLQDIDVSGALALEVLDCQNNLLTSLDLSSNTSLAWLRCASNQLYCLNIQNTNIIFTYPHDTNFVARDNPNLSCIEVDDLGMASNWVFPFSSHIDSAATFSLDCSYPTPCDSVTSNIIPPIDCSLLELADVTIDDSSMTIDITIYNGDTVHINYPYIGLVVDAMGDTIQNGSSWIFVQFAGDSVIYSYTLNNVSPVYPLTVYFAYSDLMGGMGTDTCVLSYAVPVGIPETPTQAKRLLYITDILGRTTHPAPNRVLFYLYDDGSVEKKIRLER